MPDNNSKKTTGKTKKGGHVVSQKISSHGNEVLIFYIGGASDKKAWLAQKANENIVDTQKAIENYLGQQHNNKRINITKKYFSAYIGYFEVYDEQGRNKVIENYIKNKNINNLKIIIIGHSLGAWNGTHFANYLIQKGYPVDYLITIDPVGVGSAVKEIADVIKGTPSSPKVRKKWINIRETGGGFSDWVARAGGRWIPFYESSSDDPHISYLSSYSHVYTWEAFNIKSISRDGKHINPRPEIDNNPIPKLEKIVYDHKYDTPINWKRLEWPAKTSAWDNIYSDLMNWLKA